MPAALVALGWISLPSYFDPTVIGAVASVLTIVLVSRAGRVSRQEAVYRIRLHRTLAADRDLAKTRVTLVAPVLLVLYGLLMPAALLHWYVVPYQRATGELLADGSINWAGSEALFALGPGVLFVPLGLVSIWVIWRRYGPLDD